VNRFPLVISDTAENDIAQAIAWYKERNEKAAEGYKEAVFEVIEYLERKPDTKPPNENGDRRWVIKRYSCTVIYDFDGITVTVLAIAPNRRAPYWH
jgi:plasmid stabilization system protein ParE